MKKYRTNFVSATKNKAKSESSTNGVKVFRIRARSPDQAKKNRIRNPYQGFILQEDEESLSKSWIPPEVKYLLKSFHMFGEFDPSLFAEVSLVCLLLCDLFLSIFMLLYLRYVVILRD